MSHIPVDPAIDSVVIAAELGLDHAWVDGNGYETLVTVPTHELVGEENVALPASVKGHEKRERGHTSLLWP